MVEEKRALIKCPHCRETIRSDNNYCDHCGKSILSPSTRRREITAWTKWLGGLSVLAIVVVLAIQFWPSSKGTTITQVPQTTTEFGLAANQSRFTPRIDGTISSGEWNDAAKVDFNLLLPESHDCTMYVKNDSRNLYVALKVNDQHYFPAVLYIYFDSNGNGKIFDIGDDCLTIRLSDGLACDSFWTGPTGIQWDTSYGGAMDIVAAGRYTEAEYTFETLHPLNSGDIAHDFTRAPGSNLAFIIRFFEDYGQEAWWPGSEQCAWLHLAQQ